jgi:hypothetical protein
METEPQKANQIKVAQREGFISTFVVPFGICCKGFTKGKFSGLRFCR